MFTTENSMIVAALLLVTGFLSIPMLGDAAMASPKKYIPASDDPVLVACSKRYPLKLFELTLPPGGEDHAEILRESFGIGREWGVAENMEIAPDANGQPSLVQVNFKAWATSPSEQSTPVAGASFYTKAGMNGKRSKACLRYAVYFPKNFDFVSGGKLPGLYAGSPAPSGGQRPKADDGFSMRLMWRKGGRGELYGYFPNMKPDSASGGDSIGAGSWTFKRGKWTHIEMEVVLNSPPNSNGKAHIWIDGTPVLHVKGIDYRQSRALGVGGLMFSTFFGGKGRQFAPRRDQVLYFKAFETYGQ